MTARSWDGICPVCLRQGVEATRIESAVPRRNDGPMENRTYSDDAFLVRCPACGEFVVTECDRVNLRSKPQRAKWDHLRLSALLREHATHKHTDHPLPRIWLRYGMEAYGPLKLDHLAPIDLDELLSRWPQTVSERLDRVLCNIARLSPTGGHVVTFPRHDIARLSPTGGHVETFPRHDESTLGILFASTEEEAFYHVSALTDLGRLEKVPGSSSGDSFRLTPAGWDRFVQLTRGSSSPENPVFVAMWFGVKENKEPNDMTTEQMTGIYMEGIKPAVERAGYRVSRVDLEEFNDSIMDKVFGDIRAAPFVVADFTGHRNGVYLEAGFARGLGRPVIQTCAESHFGKAHFDTRHLNHICWKDRSDLQERLLQRIRGTIGVGPYSAASSAGCHAHPEG